MSFGMIWFCMGKNQNYRLPVTLRAGLDLAKYVM
jgi:hypothetical protein